MLRDANEWGSQWRVERGDGCEELDEHGWKDDPGGALCVQRLITGEMVGAYFSEERIVDDLNEPDEPGHEEGGEELSDEKKCGPYA